MRVCVIGGGPAGYVAAIRLSQLGARVTVVEREALGGECTNHGCIPTKTLFSLGKRLSGFRWGIEKKLWDGSVALDWRRCIDFKNRVVARLSKGIDYLLRKNGVELVRGEAVILSPSEVEVEGTTRTRLSFDRLLIATGSEPTMPPIEGLSGAAPWNNRKALAAQKLPKSVIIIGGGVIGVEFAHIFASFGSKVTIIEILPKILPFQDEEISAAVHRALVGEGVVILAGTKACAVHRRAEGVVVEIEDASSLEAEEIIVATGRKPLLPKGAEKIGISPEEPTPVDEQMRTKTDGIYAAGDVTGEPYLAHKASHQGIVAAEAMMGMDSKYRADAIPAAIFSALEVGTVGLTEAEARKRFGDEAKVGKFPYIASGRAQCSGDAVGFVKIVADPEGKILGFHAAGEGAAELAAIGAIAITKGMTTKDVEEVVFAHPTFSEMVFEAALAAQGRAIHI